MVSEALRRRPNLDTASSPITPLSAENTAPIIAPTRAVARRNHLSLVPVSVEDLADAYADELAVAAVETIQIVSEIAQSSDKNVQSEADIPTKINYAQPVLVGKIPQSFYFPRSGVLGTFATGLEIIEVGAQFLGDMGRVVVMVTAAEVARTRPARRINDDIQELALKAGMKWLSKS